MATSTSVNNCYIITKGYGVRATTIEGQNALHQRSVLHTFHVTDSQNTRDQITSIELIRFKEYYMMPRGHKHISFVFSSFGTFFLKFS